MDVPKLDAGLRKEVVVEIEDEVEVMGNAATRMHYSVVERCKWCGASPSLAGNEGGVRRVQSNLRLVTSTRSTRKRGGVAALLYGADRHRSGVSAAITRRRLPVRRA
jgi:hypothetical protein